MWTLCYMPSVTPCGGTVYLSGLQEWEIESGGQRTCQGPTIYKVRAEILNQAS